MAIRIIQKYKGKTNWVNEPTDKEYTIPIISVKEPDVPGTHTINYKSEIDSIESKHEANSHIGFATSAVIAVEWIYKNVGVYEMKDVLGL